MAVLQYVADERWRLAWISGFTLVLSVGVAFAMGGKKGGSESMMMVVAAYGGFSSILRVLDGLLIIDSCGSGGVCAGREYRICSMLRRRSNCSLLRLIGNAEAG